MITETIAAAATAPANTDAGGSFEARGRVTGMLNEQGFFAQSDYEFGLDTLQDTSRVSLEAYLSKGPVDDETVLFLKGFLMNSRDINFTPFGD